MLQAMNKPVRWEKKESDIKIKIIGEEKINGIITRAEAKWQTEGKNSTQYLCNLEKI
jgi:hypothetical protein